MPSLLRNPLRDEVDPGPEPDPRPFHEKLRGYAPTPLREAPSIAERLAVGEVWVKDESSRLGLPAFKILGASWATYRALVRRLGEEPTWETIDELAERVAPLRPLTLATATDGNHGRAVARMARWLGLGARILVPAGTTQPRIDAIESEGAEVGVVDGSYDDALRRAGELASREVEVVADTAITGLEESPRHASEGYATIFRELDDQLPAPPDLVAVQIGSGALSAAAVRHYRPGGPRLLGVEAEGAACVWASVVAGEIVSLPGAQHSIMAGLNCGTPSATAWPLISRGIDAFVVVPDERAREAMRLLAEAGMESGETGASGLAGLLQALSGSEEAIDAREHLGVGRATRVLVLSTEGATDPEAYRRIVA